MRTSTPGLLLVTTLVVSGCHAGPISFVSPTPSPAADAYVCALRKVNELGYTVSNTNKEAGFITGTKQTSGLGTQLLLGSQYHDQLTVSIFDGSGGGDRTIRVTAGRTDKKSNIFGTSETSMEPTAAGIADANALLKACGQGAISRQGEFALSASAARR